MLRLIFIAIFIPVQNLLAQISFVEMTYEEASELAVKEGKHVMIDVYTTWCAPCKTLRGNLESSKELKEISQNDFLFVSLNAELPQNAQFLREKGISAYPTILMISPKLDLELKMLGLQPVSNYLAEMENFIFPDRSLLSKLSKRYESGERSPSFVKEFLSVLKKYGRPTKKIADDYFSAKLKFTEEDLDLMLFTIPLGLNEKDLLKVLNDWSEYQTSSSNTLKGIANLYAQMKIAEFLRYNQVNEAREFVDEHLELFQFSTGKQDSKQILYFFEGMAAEKI
jgi:thiol-disulfide isomerase/thioredoxin